MIFLQLRSVLGRRTGNEKPPVEPYSARDAAKAAPVGEDSKVVTLPKREPVDDEERFAAIDAYAPPPAELNGSLREVIAADPDFTPKDFLKGARMAYEMIVMAFSEGDRKTLKNLLSKDVFEGFAQAINERESRGESVKSTFVGIEKADIIRAAVRENEVQVTVRIISQLIQATHDQDGKLVDGDPDTVSEVNDIWTFMRDTRNRDPNWKLIATEADQ
ncbi:putative lipid-binding transport protein (Tim44 family) [Rhizobium halophytocola]|uniref:Lipid-binding transport protein (Tim44 family) n=1 Tax=Rhizobium halophytocola TaxID=735519 RepID=A0ABS4E1L8_9HYPH|nr:putative lipid-binding transport protein (Tim44 family) [Rhizobium halophytocola]